MDYSNKEYEEYYMFDAMHLGWRGWIDFERDLYKLKKIKLMINIDLYSGRHFSIL